VISEQIGAIALSAHLVAERRRWTASTSEASAALKIEQGIAEVALRGHHCSPRHRGFLCSSTTVLLGNFFRERTRSRSALDCTTLKRCHRTGGGIVVFARDLALNLRRDPGETAAFERAPRLRGRATARIRSKVVPERRE
jgi:hypothetical protein